MRSKCFHLRLELVVCADWQRQESPAPSAAQQIEQKYLQVHQSAASHSSICVKRRRGSEQRRAANQAAETAPNLVITLPSQSHCCTLLLLHPPESAHTFLLFSRPQWRKYIKKKQWALKQANRQSGQSKQHRGGASEGCAKCNNAGQTAPGRSEVQRGKSSCVHWPDPAEGREMCHTASLLHHVFIVSFRTKVYQRCVIQFTT